MRDDDSGLYYAQARYYDSEIGRFVSGDPLQWRVGELMGRFQNVPQALNYYSYAGNNPIILVDPTGEFLDVALDVGFIVFDIGSIIYDAFSTGSENLGANSAALGADIAGAFIPFATGLGTAAKAGIKGAGKVDNIVDAARTADKATEVSKGLEGTQNFIGPVQPKAPDFVVTPGGEAIPIPDGAIGPFPTDKPGFQFLEGSGGKGMDEKVTGVRIMDANKNQGDRVNYMNESGQTVNPSTGKTVPRNDPSSHIPINRKK